MTWGHDALASDLAQHLRSEKRMVWTDMQLGPSGSPRPDVYTLERSYSRPLPTAYECKISRSDLRSDTTSGKWQKYLAYAGAVVFAVPEGLCTPADIPAECGLIVRKAQAWRHVRKATRTTCALPMDACMKLLIDGVDRTIGARIPVPRRIELWTEHAAVRKKFGEAVARAARDLAAVERDVVGARLSQSAEYERVRKEVAAHRAYLMEQAQRDVAEYEAVKREIIEWLGIEGRASTLAVRRRLSELQARCNVDLRVQDADAKLLRALSSLQTAVAVLTPAQTSEAA